MHPCAVWMEQRVWHTHPCQYVRATYAPLSCTAHLELNKTENVLPTSRISVWVLQATPHFVGLVPSVPVHELTGCQVSKQQQLLLESLTPRRLQLDSHDVLCERALRVVAQHVHSSLTSWTFARVQIDRGDGDLQSLWPASSKMSRLIYCCCIAVIACGIGLFHMARASSRLTSVQINATKQLWVWVLAARLLPRRALTYA